MIRFGLPSKGRLKKQVENFFAERGLELVNAGMTREYLAEFKGEKKKILANQNIRQSISQDLKNFLLKTNSYYLNSWEGIKKLPLRYSITVSIAAELYQRIGLKIINNNCNIWEKRIHLKLFEKIYYTFFALIKLFFSKNKINIEIDRECKNVLKRFKIL